MFNTELDLLVKRQQYQEFLAEAEQSRLAATLRGPHTNPARRFARPVGYAMLRASHAVLRYAQVDAPMGASS